MKFKFYEVSFESEGTGDGYGAIYAPSFAESSKQARSLAAAESEEGGRHDLSSVTIQERFIEGTPKQVAAAALVAAGSAEEAEWIGERGTITLGRRWNVTLAGKLIEDVK